VIHTDPHPLAGRTVPLLDGRQVEVEDWADRVLGESWRSSLTPVAIVYTARVVRREVPWDEDVVYAKDATRFAVLIHVSELAPDDRETESVGGAR
jgi:hypothetical protein